MCTRFFLKATRCVGFLSFNNRFLVNEDTRACAVSLIVHLKSVISWLNKNYSPKWRWLVVDVYRGKYPSLATDTEVNNCFSIY